MKKICCICFILSLMLALAVPVLAVDNYSFAGAEQANFARPTPADSYTPEWADPSQNVSKDAAFIPPTFGSPTADLPGSGVRLTPNLINGGEGQDMGSTIYTDITVPPAASTTTGTTTTSTSFTTPWYYDDGSIGTLKISKLGLSVKVHEGESLETLKKGAGHFSFTSSWDGNIGLLAHNRGVNTYFGKIHTLDAGDRITYATRYGTRTYEVVTVATIHETDFSYLQRSADNLLTLITCAYDRPEYRTCVQARELK